MKLAEDLAIVDLMSRGRVSYVIGIGYRDEEFSMFGVDRRRRARWSRSGSASCAGCGPARRSRSTAARCTSPRCRSRPAARWWPTAAGRRPRHGGPARLGMAFLAETFDRSLEAAYLAAADEAGVAPVGCSFPVPDVPLTMFVADDPERAWAEIGEYLLVDAVGYGKWNANRSGTASVSFATTVEALQSEHGQYQILTPGEAAGYIARGVPLFLQPLVGGIPPDIAWRYLETAANVKGAA